MTSDPRYKSEASQEAAKLEVDGLLKRKAFELVPGSSITPIAYI